MRNRIREEMESSGRGHRDGVEITSIGVLYQGPLEKKYWSSSRGKEKYPYPIGYQATRWHGGHCYFMEVLEGPRGPSFLVKCEEGITCSGQTPSVAWEEILKKKHAGAKRVLIRSSCTSIDGAEMFGFTNPLVQRLCRDLVVSANGAAESSNSLADEEVKGCKEDGTEGARRKTGSLSESSEKSPVKARRGKKFIQSPSIKDVGAEAKEKNLKQRVASELVQEEQETKETRKQKMKRPAKETLEMSQDVKVVERTQINTTRKDNTLAQYTHPEDEEVSRSKPSKLPKPEVVPHADGDTEHVGASQNVSSGNSKRVKSLPSGTKRIKGDDRSEGQTSKDSGCVTSSHGLSDGERLNHTMTSFVKDTQESSAAGYGSEVPVSHLTASGPSRLMSASDLVYVDKASQRNATSRKKRMKLAKPQKILDSVKPEKYDTEVDLTQSQGFLSVDLMCPSAEDMKKQTSGGPSVQKVEDVASKQDGYLMLLAACKVTEVEQKNVSKEKTGSADMKRKRPISDVDSLKATKGAPEVVCFPTSSKFPRLSAGHVVGISELASSSSNMCLEDESSQISAPPGERLNTDSTPGKVDFPDFKVPLKKTPRADELLTGPQLKEDVVSHGKLENMDVGGGEGERVLLKSNSEEKMEKSSEKRFEMEEDEIGSSHICEGPLEPDQMHASNSQTRCNVNSSLRSHELPVVNLLLREQVLENLEATRSGVQQKDAIQEDEGLKVSDVCKRGLKDSFPLEIRRNDCSQSRKLSTALTDSSAPCMDVSSDAVPLKEIVNECASTVLYNTDPGQAGPLGTVSTAHTGTSSLQTLESVVEVAKAVENINSEESKVCAVEVNVLGTSCDLQTGHLSVGAAVSDEDLLCKELQGLRSLTTATSEEQEASLPHTSTSVSQSGPEGTNQSVPSVQIVEGNATVIKIGCPERATGKPCSPLVKVNRIDIGAIETCPEQLIVKPQPANSATVMKEMKACMEVSSQGLDPSSASIVLDTSHQVDVDMPMEIVSEKHFSTASLFEEGPRKSLKQPFESRSASVTPLSAVCFGARFTELENESNNPGDKNCMVDGESLENVKVPRDFATEVLLTSSAHAVGLGAQCKALLGRTSQVDMEPSSVFVDLVESDLCISADRSTHNTTEDLLAVEVGAVKGTESGLELNLGNCSEIRVNKVLSSDPRVDLPTGTFSRMETVGPSLDVGSCKGVVDHPETQRNGSSKGNLVVEMVSSPTPVDRIKSDIKGSSGSSKEEIIEELVPAKVEAVKDTKSGANFGNGNVSENGFATVLTTKDLLGVSLGTVPQEQVFQSKGCTEIADCIKKHIDTIKTPVNQIAETVVVSSEPFVEKTDLDLADRGALSVMETLSPALLEVGKDTGDSAELALTKAKGDDVTVWGQNYKVSSSADIPPRKDQGSQVFEIEGGVENAESPVFVSYQVGCAPSDCRAADEEQMLGAIGEGKVLVQGEASNPAWSPEHLDGERSSSRQLIDSVNFQVSELEEIKHPGFISPREESPIHVTTLVTSRSLDDGVLEEKQVEVDACTTSISDATMIEAVSPFPSQMQTSTSSESQSQRSESDSAGRELTTSIMSLLLPKALPFLASRKTVEKKEMSVAGENVPSKTGDMDVGASVSLVGYPPSERPGQANLSPRILEAGRVNSGEFLACKASTVVGIVQQLKAVNDPVLNRKGADTEGGSLVQAPNGSCPMEIDPYVNAGNQVSSSNGCYVQEQMVSSEVCHGTNVGVGIGASLEGGKPSELHAETSNAGTPAGNGNKAKHFSEEFEHSDTLSESGEDVLEISQLILSSGGVNSDRCRHNPKASILHVVRDVGDQHLSSCLTSHIVPLTHTGIQDSVEGPCLRTVSDTSSLEAAAQVQQEAKVCTEVVNMDPADKSTSTKTEMKFESAYDQLAGCNKSYTTALETLENQQSDRQSSSKSDRGVGLIMSTIVRVEDDVSLVENPETQMLARINCQIQDVREGEGVYFKEIQRSGDPLLVDEALSPNFPSAKLESTSRGSQDAQSNLLRADSSCGYLEHSEDTRWPAAASNLSEKVDHTDPEFNLCPEPSLSSTQRDESLKMQPSYFQKMELPISIEHPTEVSTMVINVRGDEIRLCVCCGTGSERILYVFKILYTEGAHLEHQLLTVLETSYKDHYYEEGKIKLVTEESGLSFTPDGQQLILLDCFELGDSSTTDTHDGHGIKIVSLLKKCQPSTRLECEGTLLCLAVREPQRLIAAGEDGHINFWDMDPSWRSFVKMVSLPKATLDGVPFTSVTSLSVVPHLQHIVVGCNPSGFFALWDMNSGTLLYSCQMFDDLLLKTSLVDTKSMNWEQPVFSEESVFKDTPQRTARRGTQESHAALPLICLLTMVTSKERFILDSNGDLLSFMEQKPSAREEQGLSPTVDPRDTDAAVLRSHEGSSNSNERTLQHQAIDARKFEDLEQKQQNFRDEVKELTSRDPSNSDRKEPSRIPGPWDCKTVLMRGDRIVCGHALSDRPTSITSMGRYGVMGTADGLVHLWDVENGRKLLQLDDLKGSAVVSLATSSSLAVLAAAGENKRVNLYLQKDIFAKDIKKNT